MSRVRFLLAPHRMLHCTVRVLWCWGGSRTDAQIKHRDAQRRLDNIYMLAVCRRLRQFACLIMQTPFQLPVGEEGQDEAHAPQIVGGLVAQRLLSCGGPPVTERGRVIAGQQRTGRRRHVGRHVGGDRRPLPLLLQTFLTIVFCFSIFMLFPRLIRRRAVRGASGPRRHMHTAPTGGPLSREAQENAAAPELVNHLVIAAVGIPKGGSSVVSRDFLVPAWKAMAASAAWAAAAATPPVPATSCGADPHLQLSCHGRCTVRDR